MANYLITGGAGFIGSHLVEHLVEQGESVRVLDNFLTGKRENLTPFLKKIELMEGDLRDASACQRAVEDMDFVLHHAALPSVQRSFENPVESTETNVIGTVQLLDACVKAKIRRVIYAASSSAYGDQDEPVKREDLPPRPISPYAVSKLAGEYFARAYHASFGLETIPLRYFNVFGPRQDPDSPYSAVIPRFITTILGGQSPTIYGDGLQSRDFTYVQNIVQANVLATRARKEAVGQVLNIACGKSYSLLNLLTEINSVLGTSVAPIHAESRSGDVRHSLADIRRAKELLGYEVAIDFREGVRRTAESYRLREAL